MKLLRRIFLPSIALIPLLALGGCASAEMDMDDVANTAVQGLEGKGHLYTEKVMKDQIGNDFQ